MNKIGRRTLSILLAVLLLVGSAPAASLAGIGDFLSVTAAAAEQYTGICGNNLTWELDPDTGMLTISGEGSMSDYSHGSGVPWPRWLIQSIKIENGVTNITDAAFSESNNLTSVTIADSVESIGMNAFYRSYNLANVTIGKGLKDIGDHAFAFCSSLTSITLPDSLTSIDTSAFYYSGLTSVTLGSGLTSIGGSAFAFCEKLTSVTFGNSVTDIGASAFSNTRLTDVTIPDSVTSIGKGAFSQCYGLTSVTLGSGLTSIAEGAFGYCGNLTSVTLPNSIEYIGESAFYLCSSLTSFTLPDSLISIGDEAFQSCGDITSVTFGNSVTDIGASAFRNTGLTSVTIPGSVTNIGEGAFASCGSIASFTVDDHNLTFSSDEDGVLFNKDKTTLIQYPAGNARTAYTIPNSVTRINESAFSACQNLASITIPNSVTDIGAGAFSACTSLESILIPDGVTSISNQMFASCQSLASIMIGKGVTNIGYSAFYKCTSLASIAIPDSVMNIGSKAFCDCSNLVNITIENGVTSIGDNAFEGCRKLTNVTFPNSVTSIGSSVFKYCTGIERVTIGAGVTSMSSSTFKDCNRLAEITISTDNTAYSSDEYGVLYDKNKTKLILYPVGNQRTSFEIPNSVTSIGSSAFSGASKLESITIPDSVTQIDYYAFYNCSGLKSVTIPDGVAQIGVSAFYNVVNVRYNGTASGAPWGAKTLNGVEDGYLLLDAEKKTVLYCDPSAEGELVIPDGVKAIGDEAFSGCSGITRVKIPDGVKTIGDEAFSGCSGITRVKIPDSVTSIGGYAFYACNALKEKSITIPDGVTSIGRNAFYNFKIVHYSGTASGAPWGADQVVAHTHTPGEPVRENVTATCVSDGTGDMVVYCTECGEAVDWETVSVPASAEYHVWDLGEIVTAALCTTDGEKRLTCTLCGETKTETVPNLGGHTPQRTERENVVKPTAQKAGAYDAVVYCAVCGAELSRTHQVWPFVTAQGKCGDAITWTLTADGTLTLSGTGAVAALTRETNGGIEDYFPWEEAALEYFLQNNGYNSLDEMVEECGDSIFRAIELESLFAESVQTIVIEEGITSVCASAFAVFQPRIISLPASLQSLGKDAFDASYAQQLLVANPDLDFAEGIRLAATADPATVFVSVTSHKEKLLQLYEQYDALNKKLQICQLATDIIVDFTQLYLHKCIIEGVVQYFNDPSDPSSEFGFGLFIWEEYQKIQPLLAELEAKLPQQNEAYGLHAATWQDYRDQALALINSTLDTSYTLDDFYTYSFVFQAPNSLSVDPFTISDSAYQLMDLGVQVIDEMQQLGEEIAALLDTNIVYFGQLPVVRIEKTDPETGEVVGEEEVPVTVYPWLTVYGIEGSKAQTIAQTYGIAFKPLSEYPGTGHVHDYTSAVTTEPTCTATGERTYTCTLCGDSYTETIPVLGHDYVAAVTTEATCKEAGVTTYTCSRCGDNYTEPIEKKAHTPQTVTEPATCTADGKQYDKCGVCGETVGDVTVLPMLGHDFGAWVTVTEPTTEAEGLQERTCTRCGEKETQALPKIPTKTVGDNGSGITLTYPENAYAGDVQLNIKQVLDGAAFTLVEANSEKSAVYDVTTTVNGVAVQPNGKVTVRIPVPAGFDGAKCVVYHVAGGKLEKMNARYENGYMVFETSSFSVYAVVIEKTVPPTVAIRNFTENKTVDYRATVTFTADVTNGVSGGAVHWFVDGKDVGTGETYTVKEAKKSYTVQAKYMKGTDVLAETGTEKVTVKTGFFARLKAFFRALFGRLPKEAQVYLGVEFIEHLLP